MNEIITIQVGQGGNRIGSQFWETISYEQGIQSTGFYQGHDHDLQLERINVFYRETKYSNRYTARAISVSLEPETMDAVRNSPYGFLFRPENFIFGQGGAENNWAKGFYTVGADLINTVLEAVRREAESCKSLQGFIIFHTLGGGCGSGMGALLLSKLKEEYPEQTIATVSIFHSSTFGPNLGVIPYNTTLAMNHLIEDADLTFCIDNEALYDIYTGPLKQSSPTYADFNYLVSATLSNLTAPLRFPVENTFGSTLKELVDNLVPSPRLHFITPGLVPITGKGSYQSSNLTSPELVEQIFETDNLITKVNPEQGKYLTFYGVFRGEISSYEVNQDMLNMMFLQRIKNLILNAQSNNSAQSVPGPPSPPSIPDNVRTNVCDSPLRGFSRSAGFAGNTTAINELFMKISDQFASTFQRRDFLHWYTREEMDEITFTEAQHNLNELIAQYQQAGN